MSAAVVNILLVEDTLSDAELLGFSLRRALGQRFNLTRAQTWKEAVEHLGVKSFDVMLLDLSLPDCTGPETLLKARTAAPQLPIIVLTGNEDEAIALEAARHGIQDYVVKGSADGYHIARSIRFAIESAHAREALRNYRELLHTIIEGTSDIIYAKDLSGKYLLANAAFARLAGLNREDVIGQGDALLFSVQEAKAIQEREHAALLQAKSVVFEETLTNAKGEARVFLSTKGPLREATGKTAGVFGIGHDVTERKRTERHLEGVAALLNLFATGSSRKEYLTEVSRLLRDWCDCECVGVRLFHENGRLPYAAHVGFSQAFLRHEQKLSARTGSCACIRILGGRPKQDDTVCTSQGGSLVCNSTSRCVAQLGPSPQDCRQVACVNAGYESLAHAPLRYSHRLIGSLHLADSRPGKFPPEAMAFIEAAALLIAEAIHRLKTEESLVESEARFRSMFERHASVMLLADPKTGAIVDANPAGAAFYGYSQEQLRRMRLDDLQQLPEEATHGANRRERRQAQNVWTVMHRLANGERRLVEGHSTSIRVQSRRLLFIILHDVTERTLLQKQVLEIGEQERQRVGQDLHDSLGGKLTGAALIGKVLAQKLEALHLPEAELAKEVVQCINDSIRQTRSIARGLFPVELSGSGLTGALAEFAMETERRSGIRCHFRADAGFEIRQPYVALHLFRLALEAVNNALRHAEARNITISLTTAPTHVGLEVRDDGKGLPRDWAAAEGLGLRTMKYRAETIGARLSIGPADSGGTLVSCLLPSGQVDDGSTYQL